MFEFLVKKEDIFSILRITKAGKLSHEERLAVLKKQ